jgi:hypothetical protein
LKLPVTNRRDFITTNVEVTLDDARATALERIIAGSAWCNFAMVWMRSLPPPDTRN